MSFLANLFRATSTNSGGFRDLRSRNPHDRAGVLGVPLGRVGFSRTGRDRQRLQLMAKHILYLGRVNALEPIEKLFNGCARPEILEERRYRHTSPAKYPSPTDLGQGGVQLRRIRPSRPLGPPRFRSGHAIMSESTPLVSLRRKYNSPHLRPALCSAVACRGI